ncbi:MAG TPA: type II toxin-antitoxin system PemK/MazF family toxin [Thermodesulfobacteriota bacterium]|nr:type II toxin-antitoxin system PemK/MazF family toxin [Thermodesulfobacteriota bacterium]
MYKPGTIVLVNFPFTDLQSSKVRPALVLTTKGDDVIILGVFSKVPDNLREGWVKVDEASPNFHVTGLKKTSIIKTEKIVVIHRSLIKKELGHLPSELMQRVKKTLLKTLEME